MRMIQLAVLTLLAQPFALTAQTAVTEDDLLGMARQESATSARSASVRARSDLAASQFHERFGPELFTTASRQDTKQRAIFPFQPASGPNDAYELGVRQQVGYGVGYSLSAFADQTSLKVDSVTRATTSGLKLGLDIDLWQNILGRLDKLDKTSLESRQKISEIQQAIDQKSFEIDVRKLYWSLVANNESIKISKVLYERAKNQLRESRRRFQSSVADAAEVARYEAQVASRKSTITSLSFRRENILLQLKNLLPSLKGRKIELAPYSISDTISEVLTCTTQIASNKVIPYDQTNLDDLVRLLDDEFQAKDKRSDSYDDVSLALKSEFRYDAIGDEYEGSFDEFGTDPKTTYAVALELSMPIGGSRSASEKLQRIAQREDRAAHQLSLQAQLNANFEQMIPMITWLQQAVRDQEASADLLEKAIKATQRKFDQARVSVDALINDQNALQASQLEQIDTRLAVIHAVLDYFKVFSETPCKINKA